MQAFVAAFPELRAKTNIVGKHVTLCGELSRIVEERCAFRACGASRRTRREHGRARGRRSTHGDV